MWSSQATRQRTLHIYRHLLREATYLPPVVRPFFWNRIRTRFQMHKGDREPNVRIRKARRDLGYLRSANAGHLLRMRRILMMGFGRIGRRRRELISQLVQKTEPQVFQEEVERTKGVLNLADEEIFWNDWLSKWDKAKVLALVKAQANVSLPELPLPPVNKSTDPAQLIPTENIWGRPLAKKLARSKLKKEYKSLIKRLVPPVEEAEWELLARLAKGEAGPQFAVPRRRTAARPVHSGGEADEAWEWKDYALKPVRAVDAKRSRKLKSLTGAVDDTSPFPRPPMGLHNFTRRLWQRLYADIWRMTPTMRKKDQEKWDTKWGRVSLQVSKPAASHAEFFAGVSSTGKMSKSEELGGRS